MVWVAARRGRGGVVGGIAADPSIVAAAVAGAVGLDPWRYLTTRDPVEQIVAEAVINEGIRVDADRQRSLAARIAHATWEGGPIP